MRIARVEAVSNAAARLVEGDILTPDRPLAGERPAVEAQAPGELVDPVLVQRSAVR
jgi:hypothetical protein